MLKSSARSVIRLRGVRHNNLKNFDLDLPLNQLIVITGLSGSGKSSLAFDTLFAEGQRRYIETFSPYARQFFDRMDKPQVDSIEGIPPAIAVEQRNAVRTTRSTVGTMTEICDYLKVLWPHLAQLHCKQCGRPVRKDTPQQIWESLVTVGRASPQAVLGKPGAGSSAASPHQEALITFDLPLTEKLSLEESLDLVSKQGYQRLLLDGQILRLDEAASALRLPASDFRPPASVLRHLTVIQDRLKLAPANRARFVEACEQAYHFGKGKLAVRPIANCQLPIAKSRETEKPAPTLQRSDAPTLPRFPAPPQQFSNRLHCAPCDIEYSEPTPAMFSFNHPLGACPTCRGFGRNISIDYDLAIPDRSLTLAEGAVKPWRTGFSAECQSDLLKFCKKRRVPTDVAFAKMSLEHRRWVTEGDPDYGKDKEHEWPRAWYGVKGYFRWLESKAYKMHVRVLLSRYRAYTTCPDCGGARFQPETLLYRLTIDNLRWTRAGDAKRLRAFPGSSIADRESQMSLADFYALPVRDALALIKELTKTRLTLHAPQTANDPIDVVFEETRSRLQFLDDVGLGYLTLDRPTRSLSGGETERVNLTTCLGTRLVNTLFVLDEPSVGLHPRDTEKLVRIVQQLRDAGNTVVVVEHEASVMRAADQIVDLGPGHGAAGGQVVFQGTHAEILNSEASLTGQYLSGRKQIELPVRRTVRTGPASGRYSRRRETQLADAVWNDAVAPMGGGDAHPMLKLEHATLHNLKDLSVEIPLNRFVCVTGVSGSGKTTLIREVLVPALEAKLQKPDAGSPMPEANQDTQPEPANESSPSSALRPPASELTGWENLGRVVLVDQSILGKTPRSNPAVYIGAFEFIREFFAQSEPAKQRGLNASAFSFNSSQGQCERCRGAGFEKIEMQFLSDVFIRCPDCDGRRYRRHIIDVKIRSRRREGVLPDSTQHQRAGRVTPRAPSVQQENTEFCNQDSGCGAHGVTRTTLTPIGQHAREEAPADRKSVVRRLLSEENQSLVASSPAEWEWSIADMLDATVDEAIDFLSAFPEVRSARSAVASLKLLQEVGLGYLRLGQPINTLSGGESQRLKLVRHLADAAVESRGSRAEGNRRASASGPRPSAPDSRPTLFLFDEPTTGLHFEDVRVLLKVFQRLVDSGHSVMVIEHNLDVIKSADWIIDLGPEAGDEGGRIVARGTPEEVAACEISHTGRFLRELLKLTPKDQSLEMDSRKPRPDSTLDPRLSTDEIVIHGAREHNLKNISLAIPRDEFVVITGVSGSGKSTLAFDLLFAEGQRRFLDSMNLYARQFVEQLSRPDVDLITGIPPTVSIEQRNSRGGGKSTVATVTEIFHFVRLLYARLGAQFCPDCRLPVEAQTRDEVGRRLRQELKERGDLLLLAPVVKRRKGFHTDVADWAARHGYKEIRADGKIYSTEQPFRLDRFREHDVEIVVGVLDGKRSGVPRSSGQGKAGAPPGGGTANQQLIDDALKAGQGTVFALDNHGRCSVHSTERACPKCGRSFEPLDPKHFSYNSPQGWCPRCRGFGELFYMPEDVDRGAREDAIAESWYGWQEGQREICPECRGARLNPVARAVQLQTSRFQFPISDPRATRLDIESLCGMSVAEAKPFFARIKFRGDAATIARDILPEIRERLEFLDQVGLGYLQLGRGVPTLSSGEGQRIRLAAQLGSNLSGVLYVLDEPTIGLHARDNEQLLATLQKLKDRGNSVVAVEHDEETMRRADYIVDLGPGAGVHGGEVVAAGTLPELLRHPESITGQCLRTHRTYPARGERRPVAAAASGLRQPASPSRARDSKSGIQPGQLKPADPGHWLTLHDAQKNNLKNITARFPLGRLVCVTGVSGSGKSTLIRECLLPALSQALKVGRASSRALSDDPNGSRGRSFHLTGHESLKAVYEVDQSPIGRTPRSIPATYVGFFDEIRRLFAQLPEARLRGYSPGRFSFNSAPGRCPECEGAGQIKLEMNFLPPAFVRCETCGGSRFNRETLDIEYRGRNIAQVLELAVEEAMEFFASHPKIKGALRALCDTGLGYLKLGQTSPTLSGGEAQRVKLVTHLLAGLRGERAAAGSQKSKPDSDLFAANPAASGSRPPTSDLFILEEPTIGLHMADVRRLVEVLQRLVDAGHSVLVIEHNLDLIAEADWIVDLGPEGGDGGGRIVAEGSPEQVAGNRHSHTGKFLRNVLIRP